jgi:hypothetical protein
MLLDCARLTHGHWAECFGATFRGALDHADRGVVAHEPRHSIGALDDARVDFDRLTAATRMLRNTKRRTQRGSCPGRVATDAGARLWPPPAVRESCRDRSAQHSLRATWRTRARRVALAAHIG